MVARGRAEVPHDRLVTLWKQAKAVELVLRPSADVGCGDKADVVHVEAQQRAAARIRQHLLRPLHTTGAQTFHVDALFPVDVHETECLEAHSPSSTSHATLRVEAAERVYAIVCGLGSPGTCLLYTSDADDD